MCVGVLLLTRARAGVRSAPRGHRQRRVSAKTAIVASVLCHFSLCVWANGGCACALQQPLKRFEPHRRSLGGCAHRVCGSGWIRWCWCAVPTLPTTVPDATVGSGGGTGAGQHIARAGGSLLRCGRCSLRIPRSVSFSWGWFGGSETALGVVR